MSPSLSRRVLHLAGLLSFEMHLICARLMATTTEVAAFLSRHEIESIEAFLPSSMHRVGCFGASLNLFPPMTAQPPIPFLDKKWPKCLPQVMTPTPPPTSFLAPSGTFSSSRRVLEKGVYPII